MRKLQRIGLITTMVLFAVVLGCSKEDTHRAKSSMSEAAETVKRATDEAQQVAIGAADGAESLQLSMEDDNESPTASVQANAIATTRIQKAISEPAQTNEDAPSIAWMERGLWLSLIIIILLLGYVLHLQQQNKGSKD